jgi:hypothetical protein
VNTVFLATGEDYADFADRSYIPFVRHTWRTLVVPNHWLFISLLIAFEAAVGLLALRGGRWTQWALAAAIAFHVGLLSFGWGFYLWSIPMISAFVLLLRAARLQPDVPVATTNEYSTAAEPNAQHPWTPGDDTPGAHARRAALDRLGLGLVAANVMGSLNGDTNDGLLPCGGWLWPGECPRVVAISAPRSRPRPRKER